LQLRKCLQLACQPPNGFSCPRALFPLINVKLQGLAIGLGFFISLKEL